MTRDFLKNAGVPEDQIDKIMAEYGKELQSEKDKAAKAASDIADRDKQLETYKNQVAELEKKAGDGTDFKKQLDELKAQVEAEKKAAADKAADEQLTAIIKAAFPRDKIRRTSDRKSGQISSIENS